MKKLLLALFLVPALSMAQEPDYKPNIQIDTITNRINFKGSFNVPGVDQDKLYLRAKDWFNRYFDMMHVYISMADQTRGKIIGRGAGFGNTTTGLVKVGYAFNFNVYIAVEAGIVKYSITDFVELKGVDIEERVPNLVSSDVYVNDEKYRNKKGEFTSAAKKRLYYIEGTGNIISSSLKETLSSDRFDSKLHSDGF
ncbi:DUF4468 domain-containing protein [Mucilaginibacter sp.]|uniref:DUF4468 domain-containing protein n=1 Tax=Mucilaginibacter sp. TaxID=1882438 RepID=UPI0035BC1D92